MYSQFMMHGQKNIKLNASVRDCTVSGLWPHRAWTVTAPCLDCDRAVSGLWPRRALTVIATETVQDMWPALSERNCARTVNLAPVLSSHDVCELTVLRISAVPISATYHTHTHTHTHSPSFYHNSTAKWSV